MEFQRNVPIEEIVSPSDVVLLNLNFTGENFEKCFSKMEFTMGMDYLSWAISKYAIPTIYTKTIRNGIESQELQEYKEKKKFNRSAHSAPRSSLDEKFEKEFRKYLPGSKSMVLEVPKEDAFFGSSLKEELAKLGKKTVMLTGFYTEVDVFITAMEALVNDFFSVVISDVTSTFSERVFFNSLDMISQVVEVIDTRDLEKIWGKE